VFGGANLGAYLNIDEQASRRTASLIHFTDVRDEFGFNPPRLRQELRETMKKFIVGNQSKFVCVHHSLSIAHVFLRPFGGPLLND
jgi:hypothetical protein